MSERALLMVGPLRQGKAKGTVVGCDALPRRKEVLRPRSDKGEKHELGLFTQTRDHSQLGVD